MSIQKESIIQLVSGVLKQEIELSAVDENLDLREVGLDSITSIDVIVSLEDAFDIAVNDDDLLIDNFNTIAKLMKLVEKYQ